MKRALRIVHVELNEPYQGKVHFYFGSVAAIYDVLSKDQIGCDLPWLWSASKDKAEYHTRKAIIRKGDLIVKPQKRKTK